MVLYADHPFLLKSRRPQCSTLFPYTTLFRSPRAQPARASLVLHLCKPGRRAVYLEHLASRVLGDEVGWGPESQDRKSTRLNSSHANISYAAFCVEKKTQSSLIACHRLGLRKT